MEVEGENSMKEENGTLGEEIAEEIKIPRSSDVSIRAKLVLDSSDIVEEEKIEKPAKHFIDPEELSRMPFAEVECQTYIQDIEKVHIPIKLIDEAIQTFHIGTQHPIENVIKEVTAAIRKKPIPALKIGQKSQTIMHFSEDYSQEKIIEKLCVNLTDDEINPEMAVKSSEEEILEIEIWHCLNYIIERAFWISDPEEPIKETKETETQTTIAYNFKTGKVIFNQETQTSLTCKPKVSNSKLLDDYLETKSLVKNCLGDCLSGAYDRIIIDDILDEILDNCSKEIRLPFLNNQTQTLASYKMLEGGDDDILRRLRRPVAVDPEESKEVINLLTEDIIEAIFVQISKEAQFIVKYVLCVLVKNSILTAIHLQESRKQKEPKPMDRVFTQRKKKLAQAMRQKPETETIATQTKLAGVPEVKKLQDFVESSILCSACAAESECLFCSGSGEDMNLMKQTEILKTEDILLTYKPCYRTTPIEVKTYVHEVQAPQRDKKILKISSQSSSSKTSSKSSSGSNKSKEPLRKTVDRKSSPSGWSDFDLHPSKFWSTSDCKSVYGPFMEKCSTSGFSKYASKISLNSEDQSKNPSKSQNNLPPQTAIALKILKRAFCTRETCPGNDENSEIDSVTFSDGDEENRRRNKTPKQRIKVSNLRGTN